MSKLYTLIKLRHVNENNYGKMHFWYYSTAINMVIKKTTNSFCMWTWSRDSTSYTRGLRTHKGRYGQCKGGSRSWFNRLSLNQNPSFSETKRSGYLSFLKLILSFQINSSLLIKAHEMLWKSRGFIAINIGLVIYLLKNDKASFFLVPYVMVFYCNELMTSPLIRYPTLVTSWRLTVCDFDLRRIQV